ncbi:unnamed protein product [Eruca vesicaria subsp. sativa]|uniref:Uncharacterized protein n=1 Tax=Eruca vesicaria subsp. sativa TaxID=29727 RepID=A0ABC8KXW1_ERUVS|nr:unnamed protein product [Eruca vesicaria subsp. sativa]
MANFPAPSISLPLEVQAVIALSVHNNLTAGEWGILFQHADLFGPPINPIRIPPHTAGLWRVDNPRNFDRNEWIHGSVSIQANMGDDDLGLFFHRRRAEGANQYELEDGNVVTLRRHTVRNHQQIFESTVTFAHYYWVPL